MSNRIVSRWLPALLVMLVIFVFSAQPSESLPDFNRLDRLVKKGGHMLGYGLLAASYWRGLGWDGRRRRLAWLFAVLYAATDEFHQSFVPGRNASLWDVLVFDNAGALLGLWLADVYFKRKRL
ncbi:MAG: VanZ family protein [Chloroflexota bacterium]